MFKRLVAAFLAALLVFMVMGGSLGTSISAQEDLPENTEELVQVPPESELFSEGGRPQLPPEYPENPIIAEPPVIVEPIPYEYVFAFPVFEAPLSVADGHALPEGYSEVFTAEIKRSWGMDTRMPQPVQTVVHTAPFTGPGTKSFDMSGVGSVVFAEPGLYIYDVEQHLGNTKGMTYLEKWATYEIYLWIEEIDNTLQLTDYRIRSRRMVESPVEGQAGIQVENVPIAPIGEQILFRHLYRAQSTSYVPSVATATLLIPEGLTLDNYSTAISANMRSSSFVPKNTLVAPILAFDDVVDVVLSAETGFTDVPFEAFRGPWYGVPGTYVYEISLFTIHGSLDWDRSVYQLLVVV